MTKRTMMLLASLLVASPTMFAQTLATQTANGPWVLVAAAFAIAIATGMPASRSADSTRRSRAASPAFDSASRPRRSPWYGSAPAR